MALPSFFATTTLRTLAASTGAGEDEVRRLAEAVRAELHVGERASSLVSARTFVEIFARTFGSLQILGPAAAAAELRMRARAINPAIELDERGPRPLSVSFNATARAAIEYCAQGWWVGRGRRELEERAGQAPVGPMLAGILAFNDLFRIGLDAVLQPLAPRPSPLANWSALRWSARDPQEEDLAALPRLRSPTAALVGCGAIGHAFAFAISHGPPIDARIDLVDPQPLSQSNLQRYLGTTKHQADAREQKVGICGHALEPIFSGIRRHNLSWPGYRRRLSQQQEPSTTPEIALVALDSAEDRRIIQGALPRLIINSWTRIAECGVTKHVLADDTQCLSCTYLPVSSQKAALNDVNQLINELGLHAGRAVQLLAGASLDATDLRTIERQRGLTTGSLESWRGESLRALYGQLCGMANIAVSEREMYTVPLPQVSALAGVLMAAEYTKFAAGLNIGAKPMEVSTLQGPGETWEQPPRRKSSHPAPCICKDPVYTAAYDTKWTTPT